MAERNLESLGLLPYVSLQQRDVAVGGFDELNVDACFLDLREPWAVLPGAVAALKAGGIFGSLVPTTCLLYTSPRPRDRTRSRMPSSA